MLFYGHREKTVSGVSQPFINSVAVCDFKIILVIHHGWMLV